MSEQRPNHIVGVFLVALGVFMLGEQLGWFFIPSPFLSAIGLAIGYQGFAAFARQPGVVSGLVTAFGALLLLNGIGVAHIGFGVLWRFVWPVLLIGLGILLIGSWGGLGRFGRHSTVNVVSDYRIGSAEAWDLTDRTVWSVIGDVTLDLTAARLRDGLTHLRVYSVIGDTTLVVPAGIGVEVHATSVLGDTHVLGQRYDGIMQTASHRSEQFETTARRLRIHIQSVIGDVEVRRAG